MYLSGLKSDGMKYYLDPVAFVAEEIDRGFRQVRNVLKLLDDGATIPFIARYRKEMTGCMDEVELEEVSQLYEDFKALDRRKDTVLESIEEQGKLTAALREQIELCRDARDLEDIYLPYKPKRQSRASKARERGLEPLADWLMRQEAGSVAEQASHYLQEGVVETVEDALQGARDIVAERVSEDERARNVVRGYFDRKGRVVSEVVKGMETEGKNYAVYFHYSEPLVQCASHRILAMRRGEREGFLKVGLEIPEKKAVHVLERLFVQKPVEAAEHLLEAVHDGYKRLLFPSIETEYLQLSKQRADEEAIRVFADNLRQLLLAPPLGNKRVMGIDPGFRTGCKVVCLDETGQLIHNETIYPLPPRNEGKQAAVKLMNMIRAYRVEAIAVGNGTAGRETEQFLQRLRFNRPVQVFSVNESGASIYSASAIAREEFPEYDVTVRGAVSIGRRLMDPLAELVKIDPKSIGVGQYQHDVDQGKLKASLDRVVESCVNRVGVNVNTASKYLLTYVSGLGPALAENVVAYIREHGPLRSRAELLNVKRMGEKSFEQCAGFLRVEGADNPLDNSAVHPESYAVVERMAADLGMPLAELIGNEEACDRIDLSRYVDDRIGLPTLEDIVTELKKPGRDPRSVAEVFSFDERIHSLKDVKPGMVVPGIVTNVTNFGAFVDIGAKQSGLVHVKEMAEDFTGNPSEVVSIYEHVRVKVLSVDLERRRIELSLKQAVEGA